MGALIKLQSQTSDSELDFVGFTRFEYDFGLEGLGMGREMDIPSSECSEPLHTPLGQLQNRQDHPEKTWGGSIEPDLVYSEIPL